MDKKDKRKIYFQESIVISNTQDGLMIAYDSDLGIVYRFNSTGKLIIQNILLGRQKNEIVNDLKGRYPSITQENAIASVSDFLNELETFGIIGNLAKSSKTLTLIAWDITYHCNLHCTHCYLGESTTKEELNRGEIKKIIKEIASISPKFIELSGGEVFTKPDFIDILQELSSMKSSLIVRTNGTLLSSSTCRVLSGIKNLKLLCISLDGPNDEIHGLLRGNGAFARTVNGIENAVRFGIPVKIVYTAHDGNYGFIENTIELCIKLGVQSFFISTVFNQGCAKTNRVHLSYDFRINHLKTISNLALKYKNKIIIPSMDERLKIVSLNGCLKNGCGITKAHLSINPCGEVYPCRRFFDNSDFLLGKVPTSSLRRIMTSEGLQNIRKLTVDKIESCVDCSVKYVCGGLCRQNAYVMTGNILGKDPDCDSNNAALIKIIKSMNSIDLVF